MHRQARLRTTRRRGGWRGRVGLGWRYYPGRPGSGWFIGARTDLWFLDIDWRDDAGPRSGETRITVLQPTARIGHSWDLGGGAWSVDASLALGAEANIRTRGEAVGDGAIALVGVGLRRRFGAAPP